MGTDCLLEFPRTDFCENNYERASRAEKKSTDAGCDELVPCEMSKNPGPSLFQTLENERYVRNQITDVVPPANP